MGTDTGTSLQMTRVIGAPVERVFEAWTRPEHMRRWACPEDAKITDLQVDLRVEGAYRLQMTGVDGSTHTAYGVYREVEAPHRLVYTWDWEEEEHRMGETVVTVEFRSLGEGTEVALTHEGFPAKEATEGHNLGWTSCLSQFEALFVS